MESNTVPFASKELRLWHENHVHTAENTRRLRGATRHQRTRRPPSRHRRSCRPGPKSSAPVRWTVPWRFPTFDLYRTTSCFTKGLTLQNQMNLIEPFSTWSLTSRVDSRKPKPEETPENYGKYTRTLMWDEEIQSLRRIARIHSLFDFSLASPPSPAPSSASSSKPRPSC